MTHAQKSAKNKEIVHITTTGRHRAFSTIHIKHNLFHQSKLGCDVELQNTDIVLFKSPRYVHQIKLLRVQLCLRSTIIDWFCDATSVPFGRLLTGLSPRTVLFRNVPSKFKVPEELKHLKHLDKENTNFLYCASVPTLFCTSKFHILKTCPKIFFQCLSEGVVYLLQGNLQERKTNHVKKHEQKSCTISEKDIPEAKEKSISVAKGIAANKKVISSLFLVHLI